MTATTQSKSKSKSVSTTLYTGKHSLHVIHAAHSAMRNLRKTPNDSISDYLLQMPRLENEKSYQLFAAIQQLYAKRDNLFSHDVKTILTANGSLYQNGQYDGTVHEGYSDFVQNHRVARAFGEPKVRPIHVSLVSEFEALVAEQRNLLSEAQAVINFLCRTIANLDYCALVKDYVPEAVYDHFKLPVTLIQPAYPLNARQAMFLKQNARPLEAIKLRYLESLIN